MARRPHFSLAFVRASAMTSVALIFVLLAGACASKQTAVGPGGECFLASDCALGLVCLEQPNGTRQCGDDLSKVAGRPPPEGGSGEAGEAGGQPDPVEAGADTGPPPSDSGTAPIDAGSDA